jgi:hypothetical protein
VTIADVLARMEELDRTLPADDGVRWFNRLYLEVTRAVAANEADAAETFLAALDLYFAGAYFAALDAAGDGAELPTGFPYHAWKPLFEARHERDVAPVQYALAGMNAHINHDLAVGVCTVCVARGVEPRTDSPEHAEYLAVNPLIADVEARVKKWLLTDAVAELDRDFGPVDDVIAIWSVERARDAAWIRAQVLWHLRALPALRADYLEINDRATELQSRGLLVPVGLVA